jgi:site-specific recombinase XerD
MNGYDFPTSAAERYDRALRRGCKLSPVPAGCTAPQPSAAWPLENVELLERYRSWLAEGGATREVIEHHRLPMTGHVLGLNLKPHDRLHLDADLEKAMAYIEAKQFSKSWIDNCRHSLDWFRCFLRHERGLATPNEAPSYGNVTRYQEGLPEWLLEQLEKYLQVRRANWRPARLAVSTYQFWQKYTRLWRWLYKEHTIKALTDILRTHLYAYIDEMLAQGYAVSSVNQDLYAFQAFLRFLQQRRYTVTAALLSLRGLKQPDKLPRFLTDEHVRLVRDDLAERAATARTPCRIRDTRLDLAAFYLLWQGGLRVCELEDLTLGDLYLQERRIIIRRGKGMKDRTIYLTEAAVAALEAYLEVRGPGNSDHVFLYRHKQMSKDLARCRMKAAGQRTAVKVTPHMLRHTFGTQLVNAGCRITTIQALLGHRRLNSTMVYARVHDQTVADDYYAAMAIIEKQMEFTPSQAVGHQNGNGSAFPELLALVDALKVDESQCALVAEIRRGLLALTSERQRVAGRFPASLFVG